MNFTIERAVEVLANTPDVIRTMLREICDEWSHNDYGTDTWSVFDIVGHLIHGERTDWIPRLKIILEHGEARPFDPFDRTAQFSDSDGKKLNELLAEFEKLRAENVETLLALKLTDDQLKKRGMHPSLGPVTLQELLSAWVVHDLNHIAQIAKAMAFQLSGEVGPWREYLSILRSPDPR